LSSYPTTTSSDCLCSSFGDLQLLPLAKDEEDEDNAKKQKSTTTVDSKPASDKPQSELDGYEDDNFNENTLDYDDSSSNPTMTSSTCRCSSFDDLQLSPLAKDEEDEDNVKKQKPTATEDSTPAIKEPQSELVDFNENTLNPEDYDDSSSNPTTTSSACRCLSSGDLQLLPLAKEKD
jgi:hypothetical protein